MILITGGLGFIGTHTTRALLDLGESCVLVQRRAAGVPGPFANERVFVEQADLTDEAALLDIGTRHKITGIVHLAGSVPWPPGAYEPLEGAEKAVRSLLNVFRAASEWQVARVGLASTIGVYGGVPGEGPLREDVPLPMTAGHPIPAFKKIGELLGDYLAGTMGLDVVHYRIAAIWGPLARTPSPFYATPQLVHAAARGTAPDLSTLHQGAYAGNGIDMCYVKDCGRAIALLQLADRLRHRTYNVASGRPTTHGEVIAAIRKIVPDARVDLPEGRDPSGPPHDVWLDITRLREDTGYEPAYDTERAVADYLGWLRAGNER
ncbi:NAD-dependent epimerase/dehydratase family protein [Nonomuraea sp. M3C6]|uniref:NAD-dependent epimerase/dehydratase family protein n=1 Tax=Nonomuraea marmarensis TaxID=3351344 RepID=A0ABW7AAE1_9ACTN